MLLNFRNLFKNFIILVLAGNLVNIIIMHATFWVSVLCLVVCFTHTFLVIVSLDDEKCFGKCDYSKRLYNIVQ
jgi:uncharacterized membrane protein